MANSKLIGLTATTTPVSTDIFYIVTDPSGTPTSQKVTGANMGKALTLVGKVTITQPASSATLTIADGLTLNAGPGGTLTALAFTTPGTGVATFLATPSSANLAAAVTDETGTGVLVFATAPTFTTNITTPLIKSAGTLIFQTNGTTTALTLGTDQSATFTGGTAFTTVSITGPLGGGFIIGNYNPTSGAIWSKAVTPADTNYCFNSNGAVTLYNSTSSLQFCISDVVQMYMNTNGLNVGSVAAPGARLDIKGATDAIALKSTGYSITGSGTTAMVNLAGTLNTSGVTDVILSSITKTAAGAGSNHLNLKTDGTSVFAVRLDGSIDISNIVAGSPNIKVTKTTDTPTTTFNVVGTSNPSAAPSGFIEITEGGTSKYIPFYA